LSLSCTLIAPGCGLAPGWIIDEDVTADQGVERATGIEPA